MRFGAVVCVLAAPLVGCGGPSGGCALSDAPTLRIGVGETRCDAHQDGDSAELIYGPQGGVHITLAVETTGFPLGEPLLASLEGDIGGELYAVGSPFVYLRCNPQTETQQAWDLRLTYAADPEVLDDQLTEVRFALTDDDGRSATDTTTFVIDDPTR